MDKYVRQNPAANMHGNWTKIMSIPCAIEPWVYAEASVAALGAIIYSIISPSPREVYHNVFGESVLCHIKTIIQDAHTPKTAGGQKARRFLFRLAEFADVGTWYYFLANALIDGAIIFESQIMNETACTPDGHANSGTGTLWFGAIMDNGWWPAPEMFFTGGQFAPVHAAILVVKPKTHWTLAYSTSWHTFEEIPFPVASRIRSVNSGHIYDMDATALQDVFDEIQPTHTWERNVGGYGEVDEVIAECANLSGLVVPHHELFPDDTSVCHMAQSPYP